MGAEGVVLAGFRTLVLLVALAVVGLGAWTQHTVHDIEVRGDVILQMANLSSDMEERWQALFNDVLGSQIRMWITLGIGCFTFIIGMFILMSSKMDRLKISGYTSVPLELLSMMSMGGAFALTLTLAVKLDPTCNGLDAASSGDLMAFGMLCPLSKGWSVAGGLGWFVLAITSLTAMINLCRSRSKQSCSFEPTASSLGMSHGYQAVAPPLTRGDVPTLYDPRKPVPGTPARPPRDDEEIGFAIAGAAMGMSNPPILSQDNEARAQISGPLGLEKPETAKQMMRPARPWSEAPRRKI